MLNKIQSQIIIYSGIPNTIPRLTNQEVSNKKAYQAWNTRQNLTVYHIMTHDTTFAHPIVLVIGQIHQTRFKPIQYDMILLRWQITRSVNMQFRNLCVAVEYETSYTFKYIIGSPKQNFFC